MLRIHFINVADGDSILIEDLAVDPPFRVLVDAGNAQMKLATAPSMRQTCDQYLSGRGIGCIDMAVITHLHLDHFAGLEEVFAHRKIRRLYTAYLPEAPGRRIDPEPDAVKTVCGMIESINRWSSNIAALRRTGCEMHAVSGGSLALHPTPNLQIEITVPDEAACTHQHTLWNDMLAGRKRSESDKIRASKNRNPCSLRLRLTYGGRSVELPGDCYGEIWEDAAEKCDIFKLPHHGDAKSMTEKLARGLQPRYAVISCANEYVPEKDRPSASAVSMLRNMGTKVWYTDSYDDGVQEVCQCSALEFAITRSGEITCPD